MGAPLFEVECPCCKTTLKIDPETRGVISHHIPEKPPVIEDLREAVQKLKGQEQKRDEVFRKQVQAEKVHGQVLQKKFEELLKQAKDTPPSKPGVRDIDLD
jgi:hypothetical protein